MRVDALPCTSMHVYARRIQSKLRRSALFAWPLALAVLNGSTL
jgi:hypothetical protein